MFNSFSSLSVNTQYELVLLIGKLQKEKRGCLHLPVRLSWPTTAITVNRQRNNHVEVYRYTVKCASEDMVSPRSTLRSLIYTPRGSHPCNVLVLSSIVVVSKRPKTKRDNAFSICSAPPSGSAHLSEHPSHYGQIAFAKVQRKKEIMKEKVAKNY